MDDSMLVLAAASNALGYTPRAPEGTLRDWKTWAENHPDREAKVTIHCGRGRPRGDIVFMSWNIMSDTWSVG